MGTQLLELHLNHNIIVYLQASDCDRPWTRTTFTPNTRLIIQLMKPSTPSFLVRINTPARLHTRILLELQGYNFCKVHFHLVY